ncbi:MAG: acylhydrolase [Flavobacteriaceae bacterium TMED238]|nr:acylhydrolase [Flavobacteriales bacterium]RPG62778.1 MAG: acylhydrolase [Flavobacteriaceae bacterium TMED238]|tara:strand:- start:1180 stop:1893 length:714 start_codon:yes stop_codon:yes gene_type:complete
MKKVVYILGVSLLFIMNLNSQDVYIQGGGSLDDWANLSQFSELNKGLIEKTDKNRVVFMGNSITSGWSNFRPNFFIDNPFINRGISGQTTPQMLIRFKPDVINLKPRAVVILAGINDIAGNTGPMVLENIAENIFSMSELAKANGIDVFICSVLPAKDFPWSPGLNPAEKVVSLNEILKDYCSENNINYVDYYTIMNDGDGGLKVPEHTSADDLVHPNSEGYKVMEKVILKSLYPSN